MVLPSSELAPPSSFEIERSGAAVTGVVSPVELFPGVGSTPLAPSSAMLAVLERSVTPAATGATPVTAKVAIWLPLMPARAPTASVQVETALLLGTHAQPAVLAPALKVLLAGTVSVRTTPVAPPTLLL